MEENDNLKTSLAKLKDDYEEIQSTLVSKDENVFCEENYCWTV